MSIPKLLRFPDPTQPAARKLQVGVKATPPLERFDTYAAESLFLITQSVMDHSRELLEYVDGNRDEVKPAGIETIVIELSGMIEGGGLHRVLGTLEEAILKKRSVDLTIEGLGRVRRAEGLLAEALPDAPTPDSGFIPLALTMVFNGDTTVRNMGFLDSSSTSKGRIYAYYFARRGIYAASQAGQNTTTAGDDPEVALPLYHPRSGVIKIKGAGSVLPVGSPPVGGLTGLLKFDGTTITRSTVAQQYNTAPNTAETAANQDTVVTEMPRAGVASGTHRWVVNWTFRAAGETLTYRLMEIEEIL